MDRKIVAASVDIIENRQKALAWLRGHGLHMTGKIEDVEARISFTPFVSPAAEGVDEAIHVIQLHALTKLPDIVQNAIAGCKADIVAAREAIKRELASIDKDL